MISSPASFILTFFRVVIHENSDADLPGNVAYDSATNGGLVSEKELTGQEIDGVDEYLFTLTLSTPQALEPATYWFEIYNDLGPDPPRWVWEFGDLDTDNGIDGRAFSLTVPSDTWETGTNNFAWTLQAVDPEKDWCDGLFGRFGCR